MSRIYLTRYELDAPFAGRIHSRVECHASDWLDNADLYPELGALAQYSDPEHDYVDLTDDPIVRPRPALPGFDKLAIVANDTDEAVLTLDGPFTAVVDGQSYLIDDLDGDGVHSLIIASAMPATYKIAVQHWPYLDYEAEIVAS